MEAADCEVDDDPVEDHHETSDQGEPGGPEGFVFDFQPHVDEQHEDQEGVEGECFLGVPSPWATPGVVGPDGAHDDASPEKNE